MRSLSVSIQKARAAQRRTSKLKRFRRSKKGFIIDKYTLDQDHWTDGFVRISNLKQQNVLRFNVAIKVFVLNNLVGSMNTVRLVNYESYHRRSPIPLSGIVIAFRCKSNGTDVAPIR